MPFPFNPEPKTPDLNLDPSNGEREFNPLSAFGPLGGAGRLSGLVNVLLRLLGLLAPPLGLALSRWESELDREGIVDELFFQVVWNERGWVGGFNEDALSGVVDWRGEVLPGCCGWTLGERS